MQKENKEHSWRRKFYFRLNPLFVFIVGLLIISSLLFPQEGRIFFSAFKMSSFSSPKPIVQSKTFLPQSIQKAVETQAKQEIKQDQANANLVATANNNLSQTSQSGLIQPLVDSIQELLTTNPVDGAKVKLKIIDRQIQELEILIENDKSDRAVDRAVNLIKTIGQETGQVVSDPKVQADREVLTSLIQQYNRLQLVIQKIEDQLPIAAYLKIDGARETYLNKTAQDSLNNAPNLEVVNNIGIKEVAKIVGSDFAELKAIEILADLEGGLKPETKVKLGRIEKELATQFEKRMLALPPDVRNRKLQDYIKYSYGNPLNQVQAFNRMQDFLSDRDLILSVASLKELSLKKLEGRVLELNTPQLEAQFNKNTLKNPEDIKILIQMKMDIDSGHDEIKKQRIAGLAQRAKEASVPIFGKDKNIILSAFQTRDVNPDLLDVVLISEVDQVLNSSSAVSTDIKQTVRDVKQKTLQNFVASLSKGSFLTQSKLSYNPVSVNADVRILLPSPQAIPLLENIKAQLPAADKSKIITAEKATAGILATHLLTQVNDPAIFKEYQQFISDNPGVKQILQDYLGQKFFASLSQKGKIISEEDKKNEQKLYEKMQQILQQIFVASDGQLTTAEKQLPTEVATEINKLKQELPDNNVPKLITPPGITLPEVAKLPDSVEQAIIQAAKDKIKLKEESQQVKLDLNVKAKDLGVSEPSILPDNPLYGILDILREIPVLLATSPVDKAEKALQVDNERTLEVAALIEKNQSQETIDKALGVLAKIDKDFDQLKAHVGDLKKEDPSKVDKLVDKIINNGVARQTVLSSIEDKVYGDSYVKVEAIRQGVLKNGVDVLLDLTNQNAKELTNKLEKTVRENSGSSLKDIKAADLLTEIARTQPEEVKKVLGVSEENLAQNLETKLLKMPKKERTQAVLEYAKSAPGNPVRQFETYDTLKNNFKNPETILLAEALKDKAVQNLKDRISEIPDAQTRQQFADLVVGDKPEDLKIITEIELRVETPQVVGGQPLPTVEKIQNIKAEVEQNIIDTYKNKPEELLKTDFYQSATASATVDITDVKVAADLVEVLSRSPEVSPDVIAVAKQEEVKIVNTLVENISKPEFKSTQVAVTKLAAETLSSVPETIAELVDLKNKLPSSEKAKIDVAISVQVDLVQEHLTTQVNDPVTFQTYVAQIQENPVIAQTVAQVGGAEFTKAVEIKAVEIKTVAEKEQTALETTVVEVKKEIFSSPVNSPSVTEQTLPQAIQQEIQQIKEEVPVAQIPAVTVEVQVVVPAQNPSPAPVTSPSAPEPAPPASAPAPQQPEAPAPEAPKVGL